MRNYTTSFLLWLMSTTLQTLAMEQVSVAKEAGLSILEAKYTLATMIFKGKGGEKDYAKAYKLFENIADEETYTKEETELQWKAFLWLIKAGDELIIDEEKKRLLCTVFLKKHYGFTWHDPCLISEIDQFILIIRKYFFVKEKPTMSFLHYACQEGYLEAVTLCILNHLDIFSTNAKGETALHSACIIGEQKEFKKSLKGMPNFNVKKQYDFTEKRKWHKDIVQILLSRGARHAATTNSGRTPLHLAAKYNLTDVVHVLILAGADIDATDKKGRTALYYAAKMYNNEVIDLLISRGCTVNIVAKNRKTPLHAAAEGGGFNIIDIKNDRLKAVGQLVAGGVNINAADENGITVLHLAAESRFTRDILKFLLHKGAHVQLADKWGRTALHRCSWLYEGLIENIELLVSYGARINAADEKGETLLHALARPRSCKKDSETIDAITLLISKGALKQLKNKEGKTPLDLATDLKQLWITDLLMF